MPGTGEIHLFRQLLPGAGPEHELLQKPIQPPNFEILQCD